MAEDAFSVFLNQLWVITGWLLGLLQRVQGRFDALPQFAFNRLGLLLELAVDRLGRDPLELPVESGVIADVLPKYPLGFVAFA